MPITYVSGSLWSWGYNNKGQLGLNDIQSKSSPTQVGTGTTWKNIAIDLGYGEHGLATKDDGTLWAWGSNDYGQLGLNNITFLSSPVQIGSSTDWENVFAGYRSSFAIKTDGTLWSWGRNHYGQLGHNDLINKSSPVQIGTDSWYLLSTMYFHTFAIKDDNTMWVWGLNSDGQLGLGEYYNHKSSPVQLGSDTWISCAVGDGYSLGVKNNGTLWSMGYSGYGSLGLGSAEYASSPVQIGSDTNWNYALSAYYGLSSFGSKTDGTLWSWGYNLEGELGLGTVTNVSSPTQIGSDTDWKNLFYGLAVKTNGTLWGWGYNYDGQLSTGDFNSRSSPVQIGTATNWGRAITTGVNVIGIRTEIVAVLSKTWAYLL